MKMFTDFHLMVNMYKCEFVANSTTFLRYCESSNSMQTLPEKVNAIAEYNQPEKLTQLRGFVNLVNYWKRLIAHCSDSLLPWNIRWKIWPTCSWSRLAIFTKHGPIAGIPASQRSDTVRKPPQLLERGQSHASNDAAGEVLEQVQDEMNTPIVFYSKKCIAIGTRYRELLDVYLAIKHFQHLLDGRQFSIYTNHKPLTLACKNGADTHKGRCGNYIDQFITYKPDDKKFAIDLLCLRTFMRINV